MPLFSLRTAGRQDAGRLCEIYAPYVLQSTASFEYVPPDEAEMLGRIDLISPDFPWIVCVNGINIVGYAYASRLGQRAGYSWAAAASVYVDEAFCHTGAGRRLYGALEGLLRAMGYRSLYGVVSCPNPGSEAFHEAMGFVRQGLLENVGYKFGRPLSVAYYCKTLLPAVNDPPPPRPFSQLAPGEVAACL